jgi:hypothetical protein
VLLSENKDLSKENKDNKYKRRTCTVFRSFGGVRARKDVLKNQLIDKKLKDKLTLMPGVRLLLVVSVVVQK